MAEQTPPPRPSLKLPAKPGMPVKPPGGPTPQFDVTKSPFKEPNPGAANSPQSAALPPSAGPSSGPPLPPPGSLEQAKPQQPPPPTATPPSSPPKVSPTLAVQPPTPTPAVTPPPALSSGPTPAASPSPLPSLASSPPIAQPAPIASPTPPIGGAGIPVPGKSEDKTSSASISTEKNVSPVAKNKPSIIFLIIDFLIFGAATAGCILLQLHY